MNHLVEGAKLAISNGPNNITPGYRECIIWDEMYTNALYHRLDYYKQGYKLEDLPSIS